MNLAYVDHNGSGNFEPGQDSQVMLDDLKGDEVWGAGPARYDDLKAAVVANGGRANSQQIAAWYLANKGLPGSTQGDERADNYHLTTTPTVPPGISHPVVAYSLALVDSQLRMEYSVQSRAGIVRDGDVAVLDNDGDGKPDPRHDSLLSMTIRDEASQRDYIGNMVPYDRLEQAIREGRGRVSEAELYQRLSGVVLGDRATEAHVAHITALPDPLRYIERKIEKTFGRNDDGSLYVDYNLTNDTSWYPYGGWEQR
jgi:hypothetical protein